MVSVYFYHSYSLAFLCKISNQFYKNNIVFQFMPKYNLDIKYKLSKIALGIVIV